MATNGTDNATGAQNDPFKTIAEAIPVALATGSSVYVTAGTYFFEESVALVSGVNLLGGFSAGTSCLRNTSQNVTTIRSTTNATLTATDITSPTIIEGFTLLNISNASRVFGSSVVLVESTEPQSANFLRIQNNIIQGANNNLGESYGVKVQNASPILVNNIVVGGNSQKSYGISLSGSPATKVFHNTIRAGVATGVSSTPRSVRTAGSTPIFVNNILATDFGSDDQTLIAIEDFDLPSGTIIRGNLLQGTPGGLTPKLLTDKNFRVTTSINDLNTLDPNGIADGDGIANNLSILGGTPADFFVNYSGGNYHLKAGSAAINSGINPTLVENLSISKDLEGNNRPKGGFYDIGAYEY